MSVDIKLFEDIFNKLYLEVMWKVYKLQYIFKNHIKIYHQTKSYRLSKFSFLSYKMEQGGMKVKTFFNNLYIWITIINNLN